MEEASVGGTEDGIGRGVSGKVVAREGKLIEGLSYPGWGALQ